MQWRVLSGFKVMDEFRGEQRPLADRYFGSYDKGAGLGDVIWLDRKVERNWYLAGIADSLPADRCNPAAA